MEEKGGSRQRNLEKKEGRWIRKDRIKRKDDEGQRREEDKRTN